MPKNQNARKPEADKASAFLHIRCHPDDKRRWQKAAKGGKLAAWVTQALNDAAQRK